jgi:membrane associated rhomboid family serine protease
VLATLASLQQPELLSDTALYGPSVEAGQWYRLVSTVFMHGNLLHLFMNMSAVYTLGVQLERAVGSLRLLYVSAASALGAGAFVLLFGFGMPTVGASGVLCGYLGAMLPIATRAGRRWIWTTVLQIAVISLLPMVSWQGHLGGFAFGIAAGLLLKLPRGLFLPLSVALLSGAAAVTAWSAQQEGRFSVGARR